MPSSLVFVGCCIPAPLLLPRINQDILCCNRIAGTSSTFGDFVHHSWHAICWLHSQRCESIDIARSPKNLASSSGRAIYLATWWIVCRCKRWDEGEELLEVVEVCRVLVEVAGRFVGCLKEHQKHATQEILWQKQFCHWSKTNDPVCCHSACKFPELLCGWICCFCYLIFCGWMMKMMMNFFCWRSSSLIEGCWEQHYLWLSKIDFIHESIDYATPEPCWRCYASVIFFKMTKNLQCR